VVDLNPFFALGQEKPHPVFAHVNPEKQKIQTWSLKEDKLTIEAKEGMCC
jgi:6-phosphogluconolactonase (cycloisomerase 2 family)